ncbi:MAG: hypothetical protein KAH38_12100, partial [Candidatus Hydrogenedentes bacterium]|nr:hypothetical protein [Candidatus Hydrogenedentota bacterium]
MNKWQNAVERTFTVRNRTKVFSLGVQITLLLLLLYTPLSYAVPCTDPAANANGDTWSWECYLKSSCDEQGNPCQANDVNMLGAYVGDINGNALAICQYGETVSGYLWAELFNGTGTSRYAVQVNLDVYLDGVYDSSINACAYDLMTAGQQSYALLGSISYTCGQQFSVHNTWIAW